MFQRVANKSRWFGAIEYNLRPYQADLFGGAFNGQAFRQLIFFDLLRQCDFDCILETGTFRGSTTLFMARNTQIPIYSSESNPRFYAYAARRLKSYNSVHLFCQDSRNFLKMFLIDQQPRAFIYLDAHWREDLPLREETDFIFRSLSDFVVMVDDFEVPGDTSYGFDDYGPGKRLSLSDFPFHIDSRVACYFPSRAGRDESGSKRGCVILASQNLVEAVDQMRCLKRFNGSVSPA